MGADSRRDRDPKNYLLRAGNNWFRGLDRM
jgi:hypothetical protein